MMSLSPSYNLKAKALAEKEIRTRRQQRRRELSLLSLSAFLARTKIEVPTSETDLVALAPFVPWPAQDAALRAMQTERLLVILKARQLGISWLACGYALQACVLRDNQTILLFSQGQLEANELIRRIGVLYAHHSNRGDFPSITRDRASEIGFSNGSRIISLPATRKAGRSFTASVVILDEWAFMQWGSEMLSAVKPTIDAGGQLFIISTADRPGSEYHQLWQAAENRGNGYYPIFIPWYARPDRYETWRDEKIAESGGDTASIKREYPASALEAFTFAAGLVYDIWSDGPDDGNISDDADYIPGAGEIYWAVDDGYAGKLDKMGYYTADSHPRVFLLCQLMANGAINVFQELYACGMLSEVQIDQVIALGYPLPEYAAIDKSAAELRGRLNGMGIYTRNGPASVDESIKVLRGMIARDGNGWRRIRVHSRCKHLRYEMLNYRQDDNNNPIKAYDHGPDSLRYLAWTMRFEQ